MTYFVRHADSEGPSEYELKQEFCYPGTEIWIRFERHGISGGRWQPLYSVSLKNIETGQLSTLCYSQTGKYEGKEKLYTLQTAKKKARSFARHEVWLKEAGVL